MTIKELHLQIDIIIQRLKSEIFEGLVPEQKDILLYWGTLKLIEDTLKGNGMLDSSEGNADLLEELKTTVTLSPFIKVKDELSVVELPINYLRHIRSRTASIVNCSKAVTLDTVNSSERLCGVPFTFEYPANQDFQIVLKKGAAETVISFTKFLQPIYTDEGKFDLLNYIITKFNEYGLDISLRYEKYNYLSYDDTLMFVTANTDYTGILLRTAQGDTPIYTFDTIVNTGYDISDISAYNIITGKNVISSSSDIDLLNTGSFTKSTKEFPRITLERGKIAIWHTNKFIPKTLELTYIRKPKINNIFAGVTCELNAAWHYKVLEKTSNLIAGLMGNYNYELIKNELKTN